MLQGKRCGHVTLADGRETDAPIKRRIAVGDNARDSLPPKLCDTVRDQLLSDALALVVGRYCDRAKDEDRLICTLVNKP